MSALDLEAVRERIDAARMGSWAWGFAPRPDSDMTKAEYLAGIPLTDSKELWVTWVLDPEGGPEDYLITAITGDGPTAKANAQFIAHAHEDVPALLAEVERLRGKVARVEAMTASGR